MRASKVVGNALVARIEDRRSGKRVAGGRLIADQRGFLPCRGEATRIGIVSPGGRGLPDHGQCTAGSRARGQQTLRRQARRTALGSDRRAAHGDGDERDGDATRRARQRAQLSEP